jgi:hypothetical protein
MAAAFAAAFFSPCLIGVDAARHNPHSGGHLTTGPVS